MILIIKLTTRTQENLVVGQGVEYFQKISNANFFLLIKFTLGPQENLLVEEGVEYFLTFSNSKDFNNRINHETMKKPCGGDGIFSPRDHKIQKRFSNPIWKCRFYMNLLRKLTMRPRDFLLVEVGAQKYLKLTTKPNDFLCGDDESRINI